MKDGKAATKNLDESALDRWEKLYRVTLGAVIRAQAKTPNPKVIARLAVKLADAGYDCVLEHDQQSSKTK